ncbi:S9 family peptidase [Flavobacterium bomense]|uniref:S9 family peptidase n=1 Tax=Flavobacterium bomense TaxID=2497483 RepID=A0A3S0MB45_9FLAO|nr:prolyl oligopeptidase family serine peptidase [Flavobacterium bomense]RTZ02739.1 S9 family peptidase [Flavobacterium bomense]
MLFFKTHLRFVYGSIAVFVFGLVPCPLAGQVLPKIVTAGDYHLWSTLQLESISNQGNWISYTRIYKTKKDTLFIKNSTNNLEYVFPGSNNGQFSKEDTFGCLSKDGLNLINLTDGSGRIIPNVMQYEFTSSGVFLVTSESSPNNLLKVSIYNKNGILKENISDVVDYRWNSQKTKVLYCTLVNGKYSVRLLSFKQDIEQELILTNVDYPLNNLTWNRTGTAVAFYGVPTNSKDIGDILYTYQIPTHQLHTLNTASQTTAIKIDSNPHLQLSISDDGRNVFFGIYSPTAIDKSVFDTNVEIWHGDDKRLYTHRKQLASLDHVQLLAVWWPYVNKIFPITSNELSWVMLSGNQDYAITANPLTYEPQYKRFADMDYYLNDLKTGKKGLFLQKHNGQSGSIATSPDGKYITYYHDTNWWVYNIAQATHVNVTKDLQGDWDNRKKDPGDELRFWGNAGWTTDHKWVLYYDYNDIWAITPDGKSKHRLTKGKEKGIQFRFAESSDNAEIRVNYSSLTSASYNTLEKLLIRAVNLNDASSTYYLLDFKKGERLLTPTNGAINNLLKARESNVFIYQQQTYDQSPSIRHMTSETAKVTTLVTSNMHQKNFKWGHSEMIHFKNKYGSPLNGALFYPAGYSKEKKYPMVVYIYSTVSGELNHYVNPSNENGIGFNISNFTTQGYFVLLPDIAYASGNPGISATDCISSAVKKVIGMNVIDPLKIGLIGHSFGGYEANFIISQTNIFKAAVSGSAVSDIVSHYLTINSSNKLPEAWRYENQQYRMAKSFYEDQEAYYRNSPIAQALNIQTPILTWVGLNDTNVQSKQGMEFYIALRRLQKKNVMLAYPDEGHILSSQKNQIDLTVRIQDWFGYYLKEKPMKPWMADTNTATQK